MTNSRRRTAALMTAAALGAGLTGLAAGVPVAAAATSGLSLTASAGPTSVSRVGQQVDYTVVVRNDGDQAVRDLLVTAPSRGLSTPVCSPVALGGSLAAGATTTCHATRTVTLEDLRVPALASSVKATARPATGTTAVNAATTVTVAVTTAGPVATDDTAGAVDTGRPALLAGASNDRPGQPGGPAIDPSRTVFLAAARDLGYGGHQASTEGGTWTSLPDGTVRFSPGYKLAGTTQSIDYRVYDTAGRSAVGHLSVPVRPGPAPADHDTTTPQGEAVTLDVLATDDPGQNGDGTRSAFDPASLKVFASGAGSALPTTEGPDGKSVDLAGAGRFAVTDGRITFTPEAGFVGSLGVGYLVRTTSGAELDGIAHLTVQAVPGGPKPTRPSLPVATDDHIVTTTQIPTALPAQQNDIPGPSPFVNSKLTFPGDQLSRLPKGSTIVYGDGVTLTVPGEGTYLARFGTQDVLFTPKEGFVGDTTPVAYRVTDAAGNTARATLTATVLPGITPRWDYAKTDQGQPVTVDVRANDEIPSTTWPTAPSSVPHLTTHGNPGAVLSGTYQEKLTVPGQGVYTVDPGTGVVTFQPEPGFVGVSSATLGVTYGVRRPDLGGLGLAFETRLTVTVRRATPVAHADSASTTVGHPVDVPVLANDAPGSTAVPLVASGVRLRTTSSLPPGSVLYGDAKTLVIPGRGVFLVAGDGGITFVPLGSATGPVPTVGYQVADVNGTTARSTLSVQVR